MRALSFAAVLVVALAGCTGNAPAPTSAMPAAAHMLGALPHNISASQNVVGALDPINFDPTNPLGPSHPCSTPQTLCVPFPFTVNGTAGNVTYTAKLTWTLQANDFDLYLYDGDKIVASSANGTVNPSDPSTPHSPEEMLHGGLSPGSYKFVVDPYGVTQDTFTFSASFGHAA
ncbi:MAG: hypothetical protein ACYDBQ_03985 [Thermoplasmatota archaeon]